MEQTMIFELIAVGLSCLIMTLYLTGYICHRGVPPSISDSYYRVDAKWLFPVVIATAGLTALIPIMEHTPESYRFVAFFIVAAILFIAASPAFKEDMVRNVHVGAASILGLASLVWLILTIGMPWIAVACIIIGIVKRKQLVFWIEVGLLYNLYVALIQTIACG